MIEIGKKDALNAIKKGPGVSSDEALEIAIEQFYSRIDPMGYVQNEQRRGFINKKTGKLETEDYSKDILNID